MEDQTNQERPTTHSSRFITNSLTIIKDFRWWTKIIAVFNCLHLCLNTGLLLVVIASYSLESITSYVFAICLKGGIMCLNLMLRRAAMTNDKGVLKLWLYTYGFILGTEIAIFLNRVQYEAELFVFEKHGVVTHNVVTPKLTDQYFLFNTCLNILWNIISVYTVYTFKETINSRRACMWHQ